ncbi:MAG: hypothetical protein ACOY3Z_05625 [Thermodesulfobacteriota bacterium]
MFQESEIINLVLSLFSLAIFIPFLRVYSLTGLRLFFVGFGLILAAQVFTVIEGVMANVFFNHLEHLCYGLSGILFAIACMRVAGAGEAV